MQNTKCIIRFEFQLKYEHIAHCYRSLNYLFINVINLHSSFVLTDKGCVIGNIKWEAIFLSKSYSVVN